MVNRSGEKMNAGKDVVEGVLVKYYSGKAC